MFLNRFHNPLYKAEEFWHLLNILTVTISAGIGLPIFSTASIEAVFNLKRLRARHTYIFMEKLADKENVYILVSYARILDEKEKKDKIIKDLGVLLTPEGNIGWEYEKAFPVYGSEDAFSKAAPKNIPYLDTPYGRIGQAICYDMHFPHYLRQAAAKNIDLLFGPSNDGHTGVPLHIYNNAYRAVENGFSMVRVTAGLSAVHDSYYRQWAGQNSLEQGTMNFYANVPVISRRPFYSRIGFILPYMISLLLISLIVMAIRRVAK